LEDSLLIWQRSMYLQGWEGGDCGIPFKPAETYVVHAFVSKFGLVHAGICSSTRRIDEAGAALRILRARPDGQNVPSLAGQIVQPDRNFDGLLGAEAPKALPNALVRLRSEGRSYDTPTLKAFMPGGRYEFAPDLPQGTTLSWYIGSDSPRSLLN
jgi:hypothetical protein